MRVFVLVFLIVTPIESFTQFLVQGTVVDMEGTAFAGVHIIEAESDNGTTSDVEGSFLLKTKKDTYISRLNLLLVCGQSTVELIK